MNEKIVMFIRKIKLILLLRFMVGGSESSAGRLRIGIIVALIVLGSLTVGIIAYAKMGHDEQIIKFEEKAKEIPVAGPIICYYLQSIGLGDKDNDGILDINDKWPNLYNFPAQKYAEELGLSEEVVKELAPLNMHNGKPELTEKAKEFIDYLAKLPPDAQKYFVKAASDGKITNQEIKLMKYPFGTNEFEDVYVVYIYEKYILRDPKLDKEYKDGAIKEAIEYFVVQHRVPRENLYILIGCDFTPSNLTKVLSDIAKKSDNRDLVIFSYGGHGGKGGFGITYEELDKLLDRIKCKAMIISIDACYSGSAIPYLKNKRNRVIITSSSGNEESGPSPNLMGFEPNKGPGNYYKGADRNHDGVVTLKEQYLFQKKRFYPEQHPQLYDPSNISDRIYLGLATLE